MISCDALPVGVTVCIGDVVYIGTGVKYLESSDISTCVDRNAG